MIENLLRLFGSFQDSLKLMRFVQKFVWHLIFFFRFFGVESPVQYSILLFGIVKDFSFEKERKKERKKEREREISYSFPSFFLRNESDCGRGWDSIIVGAHKILWDIVGIPGIIIEILSDYQRPIVMATHN